MDAFSLHPYGETPRVPPTLPHPHTTSLGIADYPWKLVRLLGRAFDGNPQTGSKLPVLYAEYGVETIIPPDRAAAYSGSEVVKAVDASTQARYYTEAIRLARRQPTVAGIYIFHVVDETRLEGLQSGSATRTGRRRRASMRFAELAYDRERRPRPVHRVHLLPR